VALLLLHPWGCRGAVRGGLRGRVWCQKVGQLESHELSLLRVRVGGWMICPSGCLRRGCRARGEVRGCGWCVCVRVCVCACVCVCVISGNSCPSVISEVACMRAPCSSNRVSQNHTYTVCTCTGFLARKSPNIWSYAVYTHGSGQP